MKQVKVKANITHEMIKDLHAMHAMDYSVESLLVKRLEILMTRSKKIQKIIKEISNKEVE